MLPLALLYIEKNTLGIERRQFVGGNSGPFLSSASRFTQSGGSLPGFSLINLAASSKTVKYLATRCF